MITYWPALFPAAAPCLYAIGKLPAESIVPEDRVLKVLIAALNRASSAPDSHLRCKHAGGAGNPGPPCQFPFVKFDGFSRMADRLKCLLRALAVPRRSSLHLPDEKGSTLRCSLSQESFDGRIRHKLIAHSKSKIGLSIITLCELQYGKRASCSVNHNFGLGRTFALRDGGAIRRISARLPCRGYLREGAARRQEVADWSAPYLHRGPGS